MASVAPLLQKLDPMTMMEEGGLQRAAIAIKILAQQAALATHYATHLQCHSLRSEHQSLRSTQHASGTTHP